jgi:Rrf2 family protein
MKLLTKESDYAIRAIVHLARRRDGYVSSREISRSEKIPLAFLRRIFQPLVKRRLLESREGVSGGVRLKARPEDIRVVDIIEIFQGSIQLSECMFRKKICSNRRSCVLRKRIQAIEALVTRELGDITIAGLVNDLEEAK